MSEPKKDITEFLKVLADQTRLEILDLNSIRDTRFTVS